MLTAEAQRSPEGLEILRPAKSKFSIDVILQLSTSKMVDFVEFMFLRKLEL